MLLLVILLLALAAGCAAPASSSTVTPDPAEPYRAEFLRVAERLRSGSNPYVGEAPLRQIRARLASPSVRGGERFKLRFDHAVHLLNHGRSRQATEIVEDLLARLQAARPAVDRRAGNRRVLEQLLRFKAVAYMRLAEDENCVGGGSSGRCIFPLSGEGVHGNREAARQARDALLRLLDLQPADLGARWLLNLAGMALGEYPEGVPSEWRIDAAALSVESPVGRFRDVAGAAGVDPLNLCGGVVVEDLDGDGFLDIVTSTSDPEGPLRYFRSRGDGTFEDLSQASGLGQQLGGLNIIATDDNGDGDMDLLVLRGAWLGKEGGIRNSLLRNNGDGTFSDRTAESGLEEPALPTQTAAWGDYDGDGDLDLYVGNEQPAWGRSTPGAQLFINDGVRFRDAATAAGVTNDRIAKGVAAGDYDNDGDLDLYVSNIGPNRLYRNEGNGTFRDVAVELGVQGPEGRSFATWFFDHDNDGWLDLFVAAYSATIEDVARDHLGTPPPRRAISRLYRNQGGTFSEVGVELGLGHAFLPMGAGFGDVDGDGFLDIYLGTGDPDFRSLMPNVLLRNDAGRSYQNITLQTGLGHLQKGHGVAFADLDHDGDQDLYHQLGGFYPADGFRNALFVNPGPRSGPAARFLKLELTGTRSNRLAIGARVRVQVRTSGGVHQVHRAAGSVSSFGGASLKRMEIGLGHALEVEELEIVWPAGERTLLRDVPLDRLLRITEGEGEVEILSLPRFDFPVPAP